MQPLLSDATIAGLRMIAQRAHTMSLVIRRDGTELGAQAGYLDISGARQVRSDGAGGALGSGGPKLYGAHDMDIEQGDRITYAGAVYEVLFLSPDRQVETIAIIEVRK